jgi:hypothetical protein
VCAENQCSYRRRAILGEAIASCVRRAGTAITRTQLQPLMSACLVIIRKFNAHSNTNSSRSRLGRDNDGVYELTKEVVDFQRMRLIRETASSDDSIPKKTMSEEKEKAVEQEEEKRNQLYLSAGKFLCEVTDTL